MWIEQRRIGDKATDTALQYKPLKYSYWVWLDDCGCAYTGFYSTHSDLAGILHNLFRAGGTGPVSMIPHVD